MTENKQYIAQVQENGTVMISEEVVSTIVALAVKDVEGVVSLGCKPGVEMLAKKNWGKGCRILITENNDVTVECNVVVAYGQAIVSVAKAVQEAVSAAIESMTGVKPAAVNVNVSGIVRQ